MVGIVGFGNTHPTHLKLQRANPTTLIGCDLTRDRSVHAGAADHDEVLDINQDPLGKPVSRWDARR